MGILENMVKFFPQRRKYFNFRTKQWSKHWLKKVNGSKWWYLFKTQWFLFKILSTLLWCFLKVWIVIWENNCSIEIFCYILNTNRCIRWIVSLFILLRYFWIGAVIILLAWYCFDDCDTKYLLPAILSSDSTYLFLKNREIFQ